MELSVWTRALGQFGTNCYIVACPETRKCTVIDPGTPDPWIRRTIESQELKPVSILLTHGHCDHIGGVEWVKSWTKAPIWVHIDDHPLLMDPNLNGSSFFDEPLTAIEPDGLLVHGSQVTVGNLQFEVIHTPGHTPGGLCFLTPGHLIAGDTLFAGSIGRTDLPGGEWETIIQSIRSRLLTLPDETVVYPGHGPTTTIGDERSYNPFL